MVIIEQCSNNKRTGYAHRKKAGMGVQALVTKTRRKRSTKGEATKSGHTDTGLPALLFLGGTVFNNDHGRSCQNDSWRQQCLTAILRLLSKRKQVF